MCLSTRNTSGNCDYAIEQLVSFDRWGNVFNLAPFYNGYVGYYVLIVAGRSGTNVMVDGSGVSLDMGESHSVEITTNRMIRITSDRPIQVIQLMKDAATHGDHTTRGAVYDTEYVLADEW